MGLHIIYESQQFSWRSSYPFQYKDPVLIALTPLQKYDDLVTGSYFIIQALAFLYQNEPTVPTDEIYSNHL